MKKSCMFLRNISITLFLMICGLQINIFAMNDFKQSLEFTEVQKKKLDTVSKTKDEKFQKRLDVAEKFDEQIEQEEDPQKKEQLEQKALLFYDEWEHEQKQDHKEEEKVIQESDKETEAFVQKLDSSNSQKTQTLGGAEFTQGESNAEKQSTRTRPVLKIVEQRNKEDKEFLNKCLTMEQEEDPQKKEDLKQEIVNDLEKQQQSIEQQEIELKNQTERQKKIDNIRQIQEEITLNEEKHKRKLEEISRQKEERQRSLEEQKRAHEEQKCENEKKHKLIKKILTKNSTIKYDQLQEKPLKELQNINEFFTNVKKIDRMDQIINQDKQKSETNKRSNNFIEEHDFLNDSEEDHEFSEEEETEDERISRIERGEFTKEEIQEQHRFETLAHDINTLRQQEAQRSAKPVDHSSKIEYNSWFNYSQEEQKQMMWEQEKYSEEKRKEIKKQTRELKKQAKAQQEELNRKREELKREQEQIKQQQNAQFQQQETDFARIQQQLENNLQQYLFHAGIDNPPQPPANNPPPQRGNNPPPRRVDNRPAPQQNNNNHRNNGVLLSPSTNAGIMAMATIVEGLELLMADSKNEKNIQLLRMLASSLANAAKSVCYLDTFLRKNDNMLTFAALVASGGTTALEGRTLANALAKPTKHDLKQKYRSIMLALLAGEAAIRGLNLVTDLRDSTMLNVANALNILRLVIKNYQANFQDKQEKKASPETPVVAW